jgi:4-azaleucine resistance transporter AzlC
MRPVDRPHRHRDGARRVAPLAAVVALFGVTFGVLARDAGFSALASIVFSATTFGGSAQFAAAGVLSAGGAALAAATAALLLNARYAAIGMSVAPELHGPWWERLLRAQLVVDEVWVISHTGGGRYDRRLLLGAGLTVYAGWVAGTTLGALAGSLIGDPLALGLDAAFPALFLALLVPQLGSRRAAAAALLGGAIALALVPVAPPGVPIIAAALACLLGLRGPRALPEPVEFEHRELLP